MLMTSSSPSMRRPWGLRRDEVDLRPVRGVAARKAGRLWQETPLARIHFFSRAWSKPSMIRFHSSVQSCLTMQWMSMLST